MPHAAVLALIIGILVLLYCLNEATYTPHAQRYLWHAQHRRQIRAILHGIGIIMSLFLVVFIYLWFTFPMRLSCSREAATVLAERAAQLAALSKPIDKRVCAIDVFTAPATEALPTAAPQLFAAIPGSTFMELQPMG
jgi:hypothetical protein